jgi:hypothetical protein
MKEGSPMSKHAVSIPPITNYDPFGRFLTKRLRLTPLTFGLLVFVLDLVVDSWVAWRYDLFLTASRTPGLLQDYMALITDFVYTPVICGLYLWTTLGSTRVFQQLISHRAFKAESEFVSIVDKSRPLFSRRVVFYVILVLSLLFSFSQLGAYMGWLPWKTVGGYIDLQPSASFARAPFWVLMFYAFSHSAFNVGITIIVLRKAFDSTDIQLFPLHPDKCGGLGSISRYSNKIALGIGAIGLLISAATVYEVRQGTLFEAYPVVIGVMSYLVLAPLFFFLPLGTAHDAMQEAKDAELLRLAEKYTEAYGRVKKSVDSDKTGYEEDLKRLKSLKKLYQVVDAFPVWPFDIQSLRRFMTVVTTPLLPAIVSIISELVRKTVFS